MKFISLLIVLIALFYYQSAATVRANEQAANETAVAEVEEYNQNIQKQEAELRDAIEQLEREKSGETENAAEPEILTYYLDGTYEGSGTGFGGPVSVSVAIENDTILSIDDTGHELEDPAYYDSARSVLSEIVKGQTLDVDTVSGATFSSAGLIEAVNDALTKAVRQ